MYYCNSNQGYTLCEYIIGFQESVYFFELVFQCLTSFDIYWKYLLQPHCINIGSSLFPCGYNPSEKGHNCCVRRMKYTTPLYEGQQMNYECMLYEEWHEPCMLNNLQQLIIINTAFGVVFAYLFHGQILRFKISSIHRLYTVLLFLYIRNLFFVNFVFSPWIEAEIVLIWCSTV